MAGKRSRKATGRKARITAKQKSARRKNIAIARKSLKRGLKSSKKMRKAGLKFTARTAKSGSWKQLNAQNRLNYKRY